MAYHLDNKTHVLKYMKRMYGHSEGVSLYDKQQISNQDLVYIQDYIIPLRLKVPEELDYSSQKVEEVALRYLRRSYGMETGQAKWDSKDLSLYDKKMIHTMIKLDKAYKVHETERHTPVFHYDDSVTLEKEPKMKEEPRRCQAIKMSGLVCDAKIKDPNNEFCKRHMKTT